MHTAAKIVGMGERLISTGEAAKALSVDRSTLARWQREGLVAPARFTAGGHARWDLADLERQVAALRPRDG